MRHSFAIHFTELPPDAECLGYKGSGTTPAVPHALSGPAAKTWGDTAIANLIKRWNLSDSNYNSGKTRLMSAPGSSPALDVKPLLFAQCLPAELAHYAIGVFKDPTSNNATVRAYMSADTGLGALDHTENAAQPGGWFTFAHEIGHGIGLHDEYIEPTNFQPGTTWRPGFDSFSPGSPFATDSNAIMNQNREISPRYFHHLAEWLRERFGGKIPFDVADGTYRFSLPPHPEAPQRNYVCWPLAHELDRRVGVRGKFDIFAYKLGEEKFSQTTLFGKKNRPCDGLISVVVKFRVKMEAPSTGSLGGSSWESLIDDFLKGIQDYFDRRYKNNFAVSGSVAGIHFQCAQLVVTPRFWVQNSGKDFSNKKPSDRSPHFDLTVPESGITEWDNGLFGLFPDRFGLNIPRNAPMKSVSTQFFPEFIGENPSTTTSATSLLPVVKGFVDHAVVFPV
jgi:hypothetical protein